MTGECISMDCGQHLGEPNVESAAKNRAKLQQPSA
jgi:hypothetical protein